MWDREKALQPGEARHGPSAGRRKHVMFKQLPEAHVANSAQLQASPAFHCPGNREESKYRKEQKSSNYKFIISLLSF